MATKEQRAKRARIRKLEASRDSLTERIQKARLDLQKVRVAIKSERKA